MNPFKVLYCVTANLTVIASMAQSQNPDDSQEISGQLSLGLAYLTQDSYRFGRYSGLVDAGFAPLFQLRMQTLPEWDTSDPRYAWFDIEFLGADSINARAEIGVTGDQHAALEFRKLSNFLYSDTFTPFNQGSDLTLPNTWPANGGTTQDFVTERDSFNQRSLQQHRDRWSFSYEKLFDHDNLNTHWGIHFDFRHETKKGRKALAGTIGTNSGNARSVILLVPMDFETNLLELGVTNSLPNFTYSTSYQASYFANDNDQIRWQNPFGQMAQWAPDVGFPNGFGQLALEPDNMAHSLHFNGTWYVQNSSVHMDLSRGEMRQRQDFLPYTINPSLTVNTALPRNHFNGRITTTQAALRLSTRLLPRLNMNAGYRLDDRDNRSPRDTYLPISGDAENQAVQIDGRINRPYSFAKQLWDLDFNYRLTRGFRLKSGYTREDTDRDFSEVNKTVEDTVYLGLNVTQFSSVGINFLISMADRDSDTYVGTRPLQSTHVPGAVGPDDFENHPLLRKYYLSNRERRQAQIRADWFANENLSVGVATSYNFDDYDNGFFGLNDAEMQNIAFDLAYQASSDISLSGFFSLDNYTSNQSGRGFTEVPTTVSDPTRNWQVQSNDDYTTLGLNLEWRELLQHFAWLQTLRPGRELEAGLELLYSHSKGELKNTAGSSLSSNPLPDFSSRLTSYEFFVRYTLIDEGKVKLAVTHETYRSDDFALDNTDAFSISNVLTLGEQSHNYSLNWFSLSYTLPF